MHKKMCSQNVFFRERVFFVENFSINKNNIICAQSRTMVFCSCVHSADNETVKLGTLQSLQRSCFSCVVQKFQMKTDT
jgi:hypothetical protein